MSHDILIGIDAGTSMIKCAAFAATGELLALNSCANRYKTLPDGSAVQNMPATRDALIATLAGLTRELGAKAVRVKAAAITAQGDGMWLVDQAGEPVHEGWLWLDSRSAELADKIETGADFKAIFETTGTAINASQMRSQMCWLENYQPELLDKAATAYHCKDYLYACLTGQRATDPSEALFTFGDYRSGQYASSVLDALGLAHRAHLLPPIVDGMSHADPMLAAVCKATGLPAGLPVTLGYVDVICSALGGGLYERGAASAMTLTGTTGIHMRYTESAASLVLPPEPTGYTIAFPGGGFVQLQTNMAATLNIDWVLDLARDVLASRAMDITRDELFDGLDERILQAVPGSAVYHPYISPAGERGPFVNSQARAAFSGMDQQAGYYELVRAVYEGLAFAARDCYESIGQLPAQIRLGGGAAQSAALQHIMASVLNRPVQVAERPEAGAAGAAMIAAIKHGYFDSVQACTRQWVAPSIGEAVQPDTGLVTLYQALFDAYVGLRRSAVPFWRQLAAIRKRAARQINGQDKIKNAP